MAKGFEYIDRSHKGKPGIIYLREEGSEKKIICQDFINKSTGRFNKVELDKLFEVKFKEGQVTDKKKLRLQLRDKLIAKNKIKEGTKKFNTLCKKIQKFAEEIDKEI